jgi:hypothetical protein
MQELRGCAFCCRDFFLLHDNAPALKAASVCQFLTQKNVTTLYQPLYSPELSPPDYFLFPKLKMNLKGLHFMYVAEIQEAVTDELKVKKEVCVFNLKKKISFNIFGPHCIYAWLKENVDVIFAVPEVIHSN